MVRIYKSKRRPPPGLRRVPRCLVARLDAVVLDDLGPARNFLAHECIEFGRRTRGHLHALRGQLFHHSR